MRRHVQREVKQEIASEKRKCVPLLYLERRDVHRASSAAVLELLLPLVPEVHVKRAVMQLQKSKAIPSVLRIVQRKIAQNPFIVFPIQLLQVAEQQGRW